jgi:hypothetical protein
MYVNGKMRPVEIIPEMGGREDKGEFRKGWVWYIVRTFVNVTRYSQYKNNKTKKSKER